MIIVIVVMAICICAGLGYRYIQSSNTNEQEQFTMCGFHEEKTKEILSALSGETYTISDYGVYGESLNLFQKEYTLGGQDDVKRKSIDLYNLCTQETQTYTMESTADRQIDLAELKHGFYTLLINDSLVKKRLVYDQPLDSEPFTTVSRDGKVKKIKLLANQELIEPKLSQNILFLQVLEDDAGDEVDVFIDPYGNRMLNGVYNPSGSGNGLSEADEMQKAAQSLKEKLEGYGLRVALAKEDAQEALGYYGEDGIMKKAYESKAKYYIELGMNNSTQNAYAGTEIYYSNQASNTLANALMYALKKNTSLSPSNAYTWNDRSEGVSSSGQTKGIDDQTYDVLPALRESGGKFTSAACFSEAAKQNTDFALSSNRGMYALSINFIYLSNAEDAAIWKQNQDKILTELADAFVKAIHVSE